jgi:spore coat polysaccharide biosynthesis protein SpsF (cytidylyltransferase family)
MKIGTLINARLASKRLPKKHFRDIGGKSAIERLLERVLPCENVILATGDMRENAAFKPLEEKYNILVEFGDPFNIPKRHVDIAKKHKLDAIISLDADDILISQRALQAARKALQKGHVVVRCEGLPFGCNVLWAYFLPVLEISAKNAVPGKSMDTSWGHIFGEPIHRIKFDIPDADKIRATMDYPADLKFLRAVYQEIPASVRADDVALYRAIVDKRINQINKQYV